MQLLEDTTSAARLRCSAERSALLADALRRSDRLSQSIRLQVYGESMLPALWPGDVLEIASCELEDVRPGEIALAQRDGRLFLHRFVATKPTGFVLRGDSMPGCDPLFPVEALLGRLLRDSGGLAPWFRMKCSRSIGLLLCHCSMARRLALKLHGRRLVSAYAVPTMEIL